MRVECLLVDDDSDDRELFGFMLEAVSPHCSYRTAKDGVEALELLRNTPDFVPGFILLDMNMPRMNGLQTLEAVRKMSHLRHTPVFMYSTAADDRMVQRCKALGCDDYLVKSTSFEQMVSQLRGIVRRLDVCEPVG